MNTSIGKSDYTHNAITVMLAGQAATNISDAPVTPVEPTHSMVAADGTLLTKKSKSLSEYIAHYCSSLQNLIPATTSETKLSPSETPPLPPEELLDLAEQRLLSIDELKVMQRHIQQKTEITINGECFKLETLPEDTPLFYQFYCFEEGASIDDESLRIFRGNCRIEKNRPAVILTNSELINKTVASQISQLQEEFENVHNVDISSLLFPYSIYRMEISQRKASNGQLVLTIDGRECAFKDKYFTDGEVRDYSRNTDILDIFQFVAMYHCDKVLELANIKTISKGCIKIDFDTELIAPIGTIQCANGISGLVTDRFTKLDGAENNDVIHSLDFENSLLAVTGPKNRIMAESVCPDIGIFSNFTCALKRS